MPLFERKLRKVEQMSDGASDYYVREPCLWPGVTVEKGEKALSPTMREAPDELL